MEMEREKGLHPLMETLGLIYMTKNFERVKADMIHSLDEMNIDGQQFYRQNLSYLESYKNEFEKYVVLQPKEEFFFGYNTEFFSAVIAAAAELLESEGKSLDQQHIFSAMGKLLHEEPSEEERGFTGMEEWFAALQGSAYSEDTKWRLLELLHAPVEKFQELFEIYERNKPAFVHTCEKNKKSLEKLIAQAPLELSAPMRSLVAEFDAKEKSVYLTAVFPLIEWITPGGVFQGVLADQADLYQKNLKNAREMLPQILKLLGDKSKFEILCLLKSHGRYNLEIAEELQLTPATASHHMNMLLSNQMVTVEKKDGRVYYQLNKETLKTIIQSFTEIFL